MICSCITLLSFGFLFGGLLVFLYSLLFFTSSVIYLSTYIKKEEANVSLFLCLVAVKSVKDL